MHPLEADVSLLIRWDPKRQEWRVIDQDAFAVVGAFSKLYEAERFVCSLGDTPQAVVDLDESAEVDAS